jgi:hypothetical protein
MKRDRRPRAHPTRDRSAVQPHPLTLRVRTSVADVLPDVDTREQERQVSAANLHVPVWTIPDIKDGRGLIGLKALLRGDGGVHPAVLHHVVRRTEAEIVHMIGNIGPAMYHARRNDQHVTDLQLDFA